VAGPADAASLRLASPSEPSRFERPMRVGQAAHTCDVRGRESGFKAAPAQQAASQHGKPGRGVATLRHLSGSRPTGSSGARWRDTSQAGPTPAGSSRIRLGPVASKLKSDLGRKAGCTRVRPELRFYRDPRCGLSAPCPRKHSTRPLQDKAHGSIGAEPLATATLLTDSTAEQGLGAGSNASGVGEHSSQLCLRPAAAD